LEEVLDEDEYTEGGDEEYQAWRVTFSEGEIDYSINGYAKG
jgi:hypothetical protein